MKSFRSFVAVAIGLAASIYSVQSLAETKIRICSGSENGSYHQAALMYQKALERAGLDSEVLFDTGGSIGNKDMALNDECEVFLAQPDVIANLKREEPVEAKRLMTLASLHDEYIILLTHRDGKVNELSDLESYGKEAKIVVGDVYASGAAATWANLVAEDSDYGEVTIATEEDDAELALEELVHGNVDAILLVTGMQANQVLIEAQHLSDDIMIAPMDDGDVDDAKDIDGNKMLFSAGVPCNHLTEGLTSCTFGKTNTYKMTAQLYALRDKFTKKELKKLRRAARASAKVIRNALN
ncbi:hypothetical protein [Polycladidibacter stylochi]|uniref:hypothetical protein n=1 Tax=Polycladidibacter stylochi TaxID=1807766 RepID=UPI000ACE7C6F|nr:hypothetical protein [Pseudovibrio stylochi]